MNINNVYIWVLNSLSRLIRRACFLCETQLPGINKGLCPACLQDFPINHFACARCGVDLPHTIYQTNQPQTVPSYICGDCIATPPAWHTLTALCQYEYPVANMIQALKYNAKFPNAKLLSRLFVSELQSSFSQPPDCIMPVPLHPARQRQRGFNQAIELARPIAKALNIPLDINSCFRRADTASQASLDKLTRLRNLLDAFILKKMPAHKHIAIFDDVVTTGSTVRSLCKLLHQAGVERVDVWCIARAS